jgi:hypothetical protein
MAVTVHIKDDADVSSVEDGETFTTVLEWGTQLLCYEPDREAAEFVGLSTDQVELDSDREERLGHDAAVYGEKEKWSETPLHQLFD